MKEKIMFLIFCMICIIAISGTSYAIVGQCSNCHTMHNSEDGSPVAKDNSGSTTATPNERLLKAGCVSCHMAAPGQVKDNGYGPAVLHTGDPGGQGPGATNAGGDFYWVDAGSDSMGHNVIDLPNNSGVDPALGMTPPGFDETATPGALGDGQINGGSSTWSTQLTCAGANGCHGRHNTANKFEAMQGTHHSNSSGILSSPTTIGSSYRFLSGIAGTEDTDWQWTASSTDHNEYKGIHDGTDRQYDITTTEYSDKSTISYLCSKCHGAFHAKAANDSSYAAGSDPWRRHPTDIELPATGEYSAYNPDNGGNYSIETPVGRTTLEAAADTVTPGTDNAIVICMSCHRAHGSDQPDLLRFDYSSIQAGTGTVDSGCFNCHTTKNAD